MLVTWKTVSEANIAGFDVLRSGSDGGQEAAGYTAVNGESPAAEHSGANAGGDYAFTDRTAGSSGSQYKLAVHGLDGRVEEVGPVTAWVVRHLYMPLVTGG